MMSIITAIISGFKAILSSKLAIWILTPIFAMLGVKYVFVQEINAMGHALYNVMWLFTVLVGSGICFYFVMGGIGKYRKSK
ncbi:MAG TPA: hypothetical protein PLT82_12910 [Candidatus Hydrogenedens sp.]|nr:hypothetical protein [Candidatus Hydrogenedens sp.]HPP60023.1 hypothetical protein [Candidatus Hydrogenedens sp.]